MPCKSKAFLARSAASKKVWVRRKRAKRAEHRRRSDAAKKGWITRKRNVRKAATRKPARDKSRSVPTDQTSKASLPKIMWREWLVTIDYTRKHKGFTADLVIVAQADATPTELANQARKQLSGGRTFLANWIEGSYTIISQGEPTNARQSTKIRSFERHNKL